MRAIALWLGLALCAPAQAGIRVVTGQDTAAGRERPMAVEFFGAGGALVKTIRLAGRVEDQLLGVQDAFEAQVCDSGRVVAVTHRRVDPGQRNPYSVRRAKTADVSWYGEDGSLIGRMRISARSRLAAMSADCRLSVVIDEGFSQQDFEAFNDVPWISSTAQLAGDHELIDHWLYAVRTTGKIALARCIKGPEAVPNHVEVSPSGRWLVYKLGGLAAYVVDVQSRLEDRFATSLPVDWKINDRGELYGRRPRGLWSPETMYVRKPGALEAIEVTSARQP